MKQMVVMVHLGSDKGSDSGTVIVAGSMHRLPDGVEDLFGNGDVFIADVQLEVAHLTVECRW